MVQINNSTIVSIATENDFINEIKSEMNSIIAKTSRVARLVGAYVQKGYEQKALIDEIGLSKSTISKMNSASKGYEYLMMTFSDADADDLARLMDIPYTMVYNHISDISDGILDDMDIVEAIEFLTRKKIEVKQENIDETEEFELDIKESTDVEQFINIHVYKENALWLAEQIEYWASELESTDAMAKVVYDLIKQLKKGGK